jgi:hypothetical protein
LSVGVGSLTDVAERGDQQGGAAAKRVAVRAARVTAGLEELDQWLCDPIRAGLDPRGNQRIESIAARMVDAQAPGVAGRLRRLPAVLASGEGWHARLLEQFALLRLLVRAHRRLAELPAPLAAAVRTQIGYPITRAEVLALPGVRDTWSVLGRRDRHEERLTSRRIWLQGEATGRMALLLTYVPTGRTFGESLIPGTSVEADLHFYPGGRRALVGTQHAEPGPLPRLTAGTVADALAGYSTALAADPWTASWPVVLAAVVPVRAADRWLLREDGGAALPLQNTAAAPWVLAACSGGEPVTVVGDWAPNGFTPLSVIRRRELVLL